MEPTHTRSIGPGSASALVVANMIGVGVFTTSGFSLAALGRAELVLLAWVLGGVLAMCGALSYSALARRIPESGGEYTFLSRIVHPFAGFLAGWVSLLAGFTAPIAAAGLGLQAYLGDSFGTSLRPEWIGTGAILVAGLMHGVRLQGGLVAQNAVVAIKLCVIAGFVGIAAFGGSLSSAHGATAPVEFSAGAFAVTLVWISFAYSGWNAAVYVAGEVRDPARNVVRSLVGATGLVTLVYLALNAVFLYSAPGDALAGRPDVGAVAAEAIGGVTLRRVVSGLVAIALFSSISSMVMAGPRVYAQMAHDGLFPLLFRQREQVPAAAVALQVALAIAVLWASGLVELLGYIGFTLGLSAAGTVLALIALRRREGKERVPIPGYPWVPALYAVVTIGAALFMAAREPLQAAYGLGTVLAGVPLYVWMRARKKGDSR